jgi:cytochrome c
MHRRFSARWVLFAFACVFVLSSCGRGRGRNVETAFPGADAERGRAAITQNGCNTCHTIPGIRGSRGRVGPQLRNLPRQSYIGGVVPNTPENLVRWIQNPRVLNEKTAMPNLQIPEHEARDIAAYLYSIR